MDSPSRGCRAGSGPDLLKIRGSVLVTEPGKCTTTKMEPGKSGGRPPTNSASTSILPADPPATTISRPAIVSPGSYGTYLEVQTRATNLWPASPRANSCEPHLQVRPLPDG